MDGFMVRQGDVLIVDAQQAKELGLLDNVRHSAGKVDESYGGFTVAEGEATGHHHVVVGDAVEAVRFSETVVKLNIKMPALLKHIDADGEKADHWPIDLPAGQYYSFIQRQYSGQQRTEWVVD